MLYVRKTPECKKMVKKQEEYQEGRGRGGGEGKGGGEIRGREANTIPVTFF